MGVSAGTASGGDRCGESPRGLSRSSEGDHQSQAPTRSGIAPDGPDSPRDRPRVRNRRADSLPVSCGPCVVRHARRSGLNPSIGMPIASRRGCGPFSHDRLPSTNRECAGSPGCLSCRRGASCPRDTLRLWACETGAYRDCESAIFVPHGSPRSHAQPWRCVLRAGEGNKKGMGQAQTARGTARAPAPGPGLSQNDGSTALILRAGRPESGLAPSSLMPPYAPAA